MHRIKASAFLLSAVVSTQVVSAQQGRRQWLDYAGGPDSSHYVSLTAINKKNRSQFQVVWNYEQGEAGFNPIVVGHIIYVLTQANALAALDAATGREIWIHADLACITAPGVNYWGTKIRRTPRPFFLL